jgi:uncharacterized protein YbaR (Trm112 family)
MRQPGGPEIPDPQHLERDQEKHVPAKAGIDFSGSNLRQHNQLEQGADATKRNLALDYVLTLEMLVCPLTKTRLELSADRTELISVAARLAFPIRQGVPMLSLDEAREIDPEEIGRHLPDLSNGD